MSSRRGQDTPIFRKAFHDKSGAKNEKGQIPFVFDIIAPDGVTSILPNNMKMVLDHNPESVDFSYEQTIERIQTKGGHVEQHWGEGLRSISFSMTTGGFKRLYSGLSNITGGGIDVGGTRRESINYDKYLDMLALFHNNGQIYDSNGQIVFSGKIKVTYDGGIYLGWFGDFEVTESAEKPYQFDLSTSFTVEEEVLRFRSQPVVAGLDFIDPTVGSANVRDRLAQGANQAIDPVVDARFNDLLFAGQLGDLET